MVALGQPPAARAVAETIMVSWVESNDLGPVNKGGRAVVSPVSLDHHIQSPCFTTNSLWGVTSLMKAMPA